LKAYWWFCLEHVRLYNARWNYYQGMSESEIEADVRFDTVWQRRTWRLGTFSAAGARVHDPLHMFDDAPPRPRESNGAEARALAILDLAPPVTVMVVKARYKQLVKRHHPDANGGDKASEERFKAISEAYRTLMKFLQP
jgi:hypothetical protein